MPRVFGKSQRNIFFVTNIKDRPRAYPAPPSVEVGIVVTDSSWSVLGTYGTIVEYETDSIKSAAMYINHLSRKWGSRYGPVTVVSADPWRDREMLQLFLGYENVLFDSVFSDNVLGTRILELFTDFRQPDISCLGAIDGARAVVSALQETSSTPKTDNKKMEQHERQDSEPMCEQCGEEPASEMHECPYQVEIYGNCEFCNCCKDCERECAMDI